MIRRMMVVTVKEVKISLKYKKNKKECSDILQGLRI